MTNGLPITPGRYSSADIPAAPPAAPEPPFDWIDFTTTDRPGEVVQVGVRDIGPFFEDSGLRDRSEGSPFGVGWWVDLPWWLGGGSMRFETEQEAIDFSNRVVEGYAWWMTHQVQIGVAGLAGAAAFMTFKHPKEMGPVVQAFSDLITGTIKGIGEVIPG